jgi:hypothetical protein
VIGDVDPSLLVLVIPLVVPPALGGIAVIAEHHRLVVQSHPGDGVRLAAGAGRPRAPSISAQQQGRRCCGQLATRRTGSVIAGADDRRRRDAAGQSQQLTAVDHTHPATISAGLNSAPRSASLGTCAAIRARAEIFGIPFQTENSATPDVGGEFQQGCAATYTRVSGEGSGAKARSNLNHVD